MVDLARADYKALVTEIICQDITQQTSMHNYLLANGPFSTVLEHNNPIATQDNQISIIGQ